MDLKSIGVGRAFLPSLEHTLSLRSDALNPSEQAGGAITTLSTINRTTKKKDCIGFQKKKEWVAYPVSVIADLSLSQKDTLN